MLKDKIYIKKNFWLFIHLCVCMLCVHTFHSKKFKPLCMIRNGNRHRSWLLDDPVVDWHTELDMTCLLACTLILKSLEMKN